MGRSPAPLGKWRLNHVVEYVDANLSQKICLSDLSSVAGLSRMHFASQFRVSTGISPHTYIVQRKIEYSKQLLLDKSMAIAEVAALIGFSSQAHFTGVFKQIVGDTPHRWRQHHLDSRRRPF